MNKSGYNIPLLLYSVVKKHIPAWTKKMRQSLGSGAFGAIKKKSKTNLLFKYKTDDHHLLR